MKIIGHIYEEKNYDVFKRLPDNRDVLEKRVSKLIASMTERYICNPIIVNDRMEVIDGQGRFEARKAMNKPIHYIVVPGASADDCRRMNKYNTSWSQLDFAKSYAKKGVHSYQLLLKACKEFDLGIATILRLANHVAKAKTMSGNYSMNSYERGDLKFDESEYLKVERTVKATKEIVEALQFTGRINDAFRVGVKIIIEYEGYDHKKMIRNCEKSRSTFVQMAKIKDQLVEFERIYNKGSKEKKIYFTDYLRTTGSETRDYSKTYSPYNDIDVSSLDHYTEE